MIRKNDIIEGIIIKDGFTISSGDIAIRSNTSIITPGTGTMSIDFKIDEITTLYQVADVETKVQVSDFVKISSENTMSDRAIEVHNDDIIITGLGEGFVFAGPGGSLYTTMTASAAPAGPAGPQGPTGPSGASIVGPTGPAGPSIVSTDFGNIAELGSDGYIYVPSIPATQSYDDGSDSVKSVYVATTTVLTRTPTYNNGASGVGATLTSTSNGTMGTVDGVVMNSSRLGERVLVKNQASALENGIYVLTTVGSATQSYVLTRSDDSDETDEFDSQVVTSVFGTNNKGRLFGQTTNQPVVGTSLIVYTQTNSVYISQQTSGTQSNYQIPIYTGTARQLTKGTSKFKYDYLTNRITINGDSLLFPATNSVGNLVNDGSGVLSWTSSTSGGSVAIDSNEIAFGTGTGITSSVDLKFDPTTRSTIVGGYGNMTIDSNYSSIIGGDSNVIDNSVSGYNNHIIGGNAGNITKSGFSIILNGLSNNIYAGNNVIVSGFTNSVQDSFYSSILGGNSNFMGTSSNSSIVGGDNNTIVNGISNAVISGDTNIISYNTNSSILGGKDNKIDNNGIENIILGGHNNLINQDTYSSIIAGGNLNIIGTNSHSSSIIGGSTNSIFGILGVYDSSIIGGTNNNIIGTIANYKTTHNVAIIGGESNTIKSQPYNHSADNSAIIGGKSNFIYSNPSGGGGDNSYISTIIGGQNNEVKAGKNSTIIGGIDNYINDYDSGITSGYSNAIISGADNNSRFNNNSVIIGGKSNMIYNSNYSAIIGGTGLSLEAEYNMVLVPQLRIDNVNSSTASNPKVLIWDGKDVKYETANAILAGSASLSIPIDINQIAFGTGNVGTGLTSSPFLTFDSYRVNSVIGGYISGIDTGSYKSIILGGNNNHIISSNSAAMIGGIGNVLSGSLNGVIGGYYNSMTNTSYGSFMMGRNNKINFSTAPVAILTGKYNKLYFSDSSSILGGNYNSATSSYNSSILSGENNQIINSQNSIISGEFNVLGTASNSGIVVGNNNKIGAYYSSKNSTIIGGRDNNMFAGYLYNTSIIGGHNNSILNGNTSFIYNSSIIGGNNNTLSYNDNTIIGGQSNTISIGKYSSIVSGRTNTISGNVYSGSIIAGDNNILVGSPFFAISHNISIIASKGSTVSYADRSAIIGGENLSLTASNTVLVPTLKIDSVIQGTASNKLLLYGPTKNVEYLNISSIVVSGSISQSITAATTITVTIGVTQSNTTYKVNVTPSGILTAALFYVNNKTTTTFDVTYLSALTGTATFDWSLFP